MQRESLAAKWARDDEKREKLLTVVVPTLLTLLTRDQSAESLTFAASILQFYADTPADVDENECGAWVSETLRDARNAVATWMRDPAEEAEGRNRCRLAVLALSQWHPTGYHRWFNLFVQRYPETAAPLRALLSEDAEVEP